MNVISGYYQNKKYGPRFKRITKILDLIGDCAGKKILDIGCGNGVVGQEFKKRGAMVTGCDISVSAIKEANKVLDKAVVVDLENDDLSQLEGQYDVIIMSELIEHLFRPEMFLEKVRGLMGRETKLIITTPNFLVLSNRLKMLLGQFEYVESGFLDESHVHFFTYHSLIKMIDRCDLKIIGENHISHSRIPVFLGRFWPAGCVYNLIFSVGKK